LHLKIIAGENLLLKKRTVTYLTIVIALLTLFPLFTSQALAFPWGVEAGETFVFDVNQVDIAYSIPPDNYSATGITFGGGMLEEGSTFTLNITSLSESNISYTINSGLLLESHILLNNSYQDSLFDLLTLPLKFATNDITLEEIRRGFTGVDYLLTPKLSSTWETIDSYDNPIFIATIQKLFSSGSDLGVQAVAEVNSTVDKCLFDWFVNGTYFGNDSATYFDIYYNLKFAYEMSRGLLLGMRMILTIDGMADGGNYSLAISSEVEREGYNLPDFRLPSGDFINLEDLLSNLFPGLQWFLIPGAFGALVLFRILRKRNF